MGGVLALPAYLVGLLLAAAFLIVCIVWLARTVYYGARKALTGELRPEEKCRCGQEHSDSRGYYLRYKDECATCGHRHEVHYFRDTGFGSHCLELGKRAERCKCKGFRDHPSQAVS